MVFGRYHRVHARAIGHPQAGAQVVRIGHAVQHQNEGIDPLLWRQRGLGRLQVLQQFVQGMHLLQGLHPRRHALVAMAAAELGQAHAVGLDQPHARFFGFVQKLAHACVAPGGLEVDFNNRLRGGFQAYAQRVEAKQNLGG